MGQERKSGRMITNHIEIKHKMENNIDIKENYIYQLDAKLLAILLLDKSSGKNIIWATDNYVDRGIGYQSYDEIMIDSITHRNGSVIKPRTAKSKKEQTIRVRDKAEVFTPSWVCNNQNNLVDNAWFGKENVFNTESGSTWVTTKERIVFPVGKTWQDYVRANRMEISCGEAPYLASRYDTVTGKWIEVDDRIGILDRKIRIINENVESEQDWMKWVIKAFQSVYGFEWQGDSLLIARENLLFSFIDYYVDRFAVYPKNEYLIKIAKILSWNIWQMDGLKYVIPNSCKPVENLQLTLFDDEVDPEPCPGCLKNNNSLHTGIYCRIMDWSHEHSIRFIDLIERSKKHGKV